MFIFMYMLYFDSSFLCTVHLCIYYMEKFSFELIGWSMMYFVLFNSKLRVSTVMCRTFLSEKKTMYAKFSIILEAMPMRKYFIFIRCSINISFKVSPIGRPLYILLFYSVNSWTVV